MLIAVIFLILLLTTAVAFVMKKRGARRPLVWMVMAAASLVLWLAVMFIPEEPGISLDWHNWFFSSGSRIGLYFQINQSNWGIIAALLAAHAAFLFTSGARQEFHQDFIFWIAEAGEIALTFAVLAAADLWSLIFTWTALDVSFLIYWIFIQKKFDQDALTRSFIFKFAGSLLMIFNTAQIAGKGGSLLLADIPAANGSLVFLAALLHSGIFPLRPAEEIRADHGSTLGFLTYLLPFFSSLFLVTSLPDNQIPLISGMVLKLGALAAVLYFAFLWIRSSNEISGFYFLTLSFSGLVSYRYFTRTQSGLEDWFVVLILLGAWLLLHNRRGKSLNFFPIILLISVSGLPFSLLSYGSSGIISTGIGIPALISIFFHVIFLIGFSRFIFQKKAAFDDLESSAQLTYTTGLLITVLSLFLITYQSLGSLMDEVSYFWAGILVVILSLGFFLRERSSKKVLLPEVKLASKSAGWVQRALTFDWFFKITGIFLDRVKPLVSGFSLLLEGQGGVLWSIVFLALLITLLQTG